MEFGPKATHVGSKPVILGGEHRRGHARTPFRTQSARGLLQTIPDLFRRSVLLPQDVLRPFSRQRRVRRRACWPSWNSRLPARRRPAVAPRCLLSATRRRAASVASRGRTHRSSMSTGSNGFAYQVTHLVVLGVEQIERRLEELHEQALRIPRRRIFSVRWEWGREPRSTPRPRPGAERPPRTRAAHQGVDQPGRDRKNRASTRR